MAEREATQIKVGKFVVSIIGIRRLIGEMASTHADLSDEEVRSVMLERLGRDNYIPGGAKEDYGKAFVREFRKSLGQPVQEDAPEGLDIKVLGAGCNQCHDLSRIIMDALTELNISAGFEHVTDMREIARYGIMGSPALLINGKVVAVGSVPPKNRIKNWILEAAEALGVRQK
ncbi:MAG: thioredoxin family protein [Desulfobacteraceae bacterium]|nr:thioredoxin family protein [Desulfobacteraceae bacterium]